MHSFSVCFFVGLDVWVVLTSNSPNGALLATFFVDDVVDAEFNKSFKSALLVANSLSLGEGFSELWDSLANFWASLFALAADIDLAGINLKVMVLEVLELRETGCFFEVSFKIKFGEVESIEVFDSS